MARRHILIGCAALFGLTALLLVTIIPNGFIYVDWSDYVLLRGVHPHTAGVKLDRGVFTNGRYWVGTGYEQLKFPRTLRHIEYVEGGSHSVLLGFSDTGIEFVIECSFQYRLVEDQVVSLYQRFPTSYNQRIGAIGLRALKNVAPLYRIEEYVSRREEIQQHMYDELVSEVSYLCGTDRPPCIEIPGPQYFQLRRPLVPQVLHATWLQAAVQIQNNQQTANEQELVIVEKETDRLEAEISANITVIEAQATAEASFIRREASAQADRVVREAHAQAFRIQEQAKGRGVEHVMNALNITTLDERNTMLQLLTVMDTSDITVKDLYRRHAVFQDAGASIVLGTGDAVVTFGAGP